MQALISIICPFKNEAQYITEMIQSVLNQTYTHWELILVDDHSSDNSVELIQQYDDTRIICLSNRGEGIISGLQTAFLKTRGEFVTRMDADDLMPDFKLQVFYNELVNNQQSIVTGKVKYFSEEKVSEGYLRYEEWLNSLVDQNSFYKEQYRECGIASANWMMRKEELIQIGYPMQSVYPEDYDMFLRLYPAGVNILTVDLITHLWREHPNRTSRNSDIYDQKSFFKLKISYWVKNELKTSSKVVVLGFNQKSKIIVRELSTYHITADILEHQESRIDRNYQDSRVYGYNDYEWSDNTLVILGVYLKQELRDELIRDLIQKGILAEAIYQY